MPCRAQPQGFFIESAYVRSYDNPMVTTKEKALQITSEAARGLKQIYGNRLRGVYLYGSAARGQLTADSDIDIAIVLDEIESRFDEHERTSQLASDISLEYDTLVTFLFISEAHFREGLFTVHRAIKREGIPV
jgi:predicted nucleotidyltransferase